MNLYKYLCFLFFIPLLFSRCSDKKERPSFAGVLNVKFIEVRREFDKGYEFNEYGFQQEPEWVLSFMSEDSVKIYSPFEKKFLHYKIYHDHDSVFNMAREWLRLKHVDRDSLIFQLLEVKEKKVNRERSNVLMKFYSEAYLKKSGQDPAVLQRPKRRDTLYVKSLIAKANRYPDEPDSALAARQPVTLISRSPAIEVKRSHTVADPMNPSRAEEYLNPEYFITIRGAYKDFTHNFSVMVDENGKMHLGRFLVDEEFRESRTRVLKGIIDVYLQKYLKIIPGSTLGIPHTSEIMIYLKGYKAP